MKNKRNGLYCLIILLAGAIYLPAKAQQKNVKSVITSTGPNNTTRNIIQGRKGNIWIAAFDGIFRYDGKCFTNITGKVSSARFFSVSEDRKGNLWFGSIGSGVYCYNGKSFRNFTTKEGLSNNDINSIVEDKTGKFWFGTGGNAYIYNGKTFTILTHDGKPFTNVRSIIKDKKGTIWLGGNDGLWRCNRSTFTNFSQNFVGYIYEDKEGNIWTSSQENQYDINGSRATIPLTFGADFRGNWALFRYDGRSLYNKKPTVTLIKPNVGMICGILEANDGSIWFGAFGVYRYDGNTITDFKAKEVRK
jgi:ligand-binding sensor domain-containing protein